MDWDDVRPRPKRDIIVGEKLDGLSIADLAERISQLEAEIIRVRTELDIKKAHDNKAKALFKD